VGREDEREGEGEKGINNGQDEMGVMVGTPQLFGLLCWFVDCDVFHVPRATNPET